MVTAPWDRMDWVCTCFWFKTYIFFIVGMAGKTCKLAAKTGWSERSQLMEKSKRKLRKGSPNCSEPTDATVRKQAPKVHGWNVNCRKRYLSYFFLCKIKKMVLDIWRTKPLPRDHHALKMGGNSNNKTKQGKGACVPASNLMLRVLTEEEPYMTSA